MNSGNSVLGYMANFNDSRIIAVKWVERATAGEFRARICKYTFALSVRGKVECQGIYIFRMCGNSGISLCYIICTLPMNVICVVLHMYFMNDVTVNSVMQILKVLSCTFKWGLFGTRSLPGQNSQYKLAITLFTSGYLAVSETQWLSS